MFIMHISALLAYGTLLGSAVLLIWSMRNKGEGSTFGKIIGSLVFFLSLLSMLCIGYYGIKYWAQGNFETPSSMSMEMRNEIKQKMMPLMMEKMMPQMMEKMMEQMGQKGQMGNMGNTGMQNGEDHSHTSQ